MPDSIKEAVTRAHKELGAEFVAVRSSATAEDSSSAAWAGQLDSFLNTTGNRLLENLRKCWASLFTPRAIFYRFEKELHKQQISVAVVVQKMVQSEVSGIAFSVHPVTEDYNQLIIEAGIGLGEAVVSGQITPDSYVVDKRNWEAVDKNVSEQTRALYRSASGGNEWKELVAEQGNAQKLSDEEITELARLIVKIEQHYGFPVDVEWARENGALYITQSRPITTLAPKTMDNPSIQKKDYILTFWAQGLSVLFTDICNDMYAHLGALYVLVGGKYKQYFRIEKFNQALDEGAVFYADRLAVENYIQALKRLCAECKDFYEKNINKTDQIARDAVVGFFEYAVDVCRWYSKMDFEYSDKAFAKKEENPVIEDNLQRIARFKDEIREYMNSLFFTKEEYMYKMLDLLSAQFEVQISNLEMYTQKEIITLFDNQFVSDETINERKKGFVAMSTEGKSLYYQGRQAQAIDEILKEDIVLTTDIKGQVANKGMRVRGQVKIIPVDYANFRERINSEIEKMQPGSILVAETTAPELILACKKASAIVTDMGGMMSHAAIVSRELNIPCIVGTKNASRILKDEETVEVDTDTGVVRIIPKHGQN
jgi:phosphoenolpyruvate synthase/pyruvate phosphate dikinase